MLKQLVLFGASPSFNIVFDNTITMKRLQLSFWLLVYLQLPLYAQFDQWTWMHGDNIPDQPSVHNGIGVFAPGNKPGGRYEPGWWTDHSGKFWLFGGVSPNSAQDELNDLWVFDPAIDQWAFMGGSVTPNDPGNYGIQGVASPSNWPCSRGWGFPTWTDKQGNLWLFGGSSPIGKLNDLWKYDISTNQWTWMHGLSSPSSNLMYNGSYGSKGISSPANVPPPRDETKAAWVDDQGDLWMFGGEAFVEKDDMWRYNIATNSWTWMAGDSSMWGAVASYGTKGVPAAANTPGGRMVHSAWKDIDGNLWLYGGENSSGSSGGRLQDMWKYDIFTNMWTWMSGNSLFNTAAVPGADCEEDESYTPGARMEGSACWTDDCGNFYMYGGVQFMDQADLWKYNTSNNLWSWIGGSTSSGVVNPVYGTMGVPAPANGPGDRSGAAAWMDKDGNFWLFGGMGAGKLNDLWRYMPDPVCSPTTVNAGFAADSTQGCAPFTVSFSNAASVNASQFQWHFGDGNTSSMPDPIHTYTKAGKYTVTLAVSNPSNCAKKDTLSIVHYITVNECNEQSVFVPNVFSPNNDNNNDVFTVTLEGYTLEKLQVFNRWGDKVFETNDASTSWNGDHMRTGKPVTAGTYYYLINARTVAGESEIKKGYVTVLR